MCCVSVSLPRAPAAAGAATPPLSIRCVCAANASKSASTSNARSVARTHALLSATHNNGAEEAEPTQFVGGKKNSLVHPYADHTHTLASIGAYKRQQRQRQSGGKIYGQLDV